MENRVTLTMALGLRLCTKRPWAGGVSPGLQGLQLIICGWFQLQAGFLFIDEWAGSNININYDVEYF